MSPEAMSTDAAAVRDVGLEFFMNLYGMTAEEAASFVEISRGLLARHVPDERFTYLDGRLDLDGLVRESEPYFHMACKVIQRRRKTAA